MNKLIFGLGIFLSVTVVADVFIPYGFVCRHIPYNWVNEPVGIEVFGSTQSSTGSLLELAGKLTINMYDHGQVQSTKETEFSFLNADSQTLTAIPNLPIETLSFTIAPYFFTLIIPDPIRPHTGAAWTIEATGQARNLETEEKMNLKCSIFL